MTLPHIRTLSLLPTSLPLALGRISIDKTTDRARARKQEEQRQRLRPGTTEAAAVAGWGWGKRTGLECLGCAYYTAHVRAQYILRFIS